ncbi:MAG TPA: hypothetical protein VF032_10660 [Thermoleophilaceae bacterium]
MGVAIGVSLAVAALIAWRVPGGERTLGADVRFEALQTGEIGVSPLHPFVSTPSLLPGSSIAGDVTVRNQTGVPLATSLRAQPSTRGLDRLLRVRVASGAQTLYDGMLAGLRTAGTRPLTLRPAQAARVRVRASLPDGLRNGFQGRILDVGLEIQTRRAR